MDGLIELVFESVPTSALNGLLADLVGSEPLEISHSELGVIDCKSADYLKLATATEEPASIFVKLADASLGNVSVPRPLVQILWSGGSIDVVLSFSSDDVAGNQRSTMKEAAEVVAEKHGIASFYCGFEPAADPATRLFTGKKPGPLLSI